LSLGKRISMNNMIEKEDINIGLAVDIDETLSWTVGHWVKQMQDKFGNPENLTVKEMVEKYRYTQNVPYWQSAEALEWVAKNIHSNQTQEDLPLIEDANSYLNKINKVIPIVAYITVRPEKVLNGTKNWLEKHNFPSAPIVCKPNQITKSDGNKWKAKILEKLHPNVLGVIDDNAELLKFLSKDYKGKVFLYDHSHNLDIPCSIACKDWKEVYNEVKKYSKKL